MSTRHYIFLVLTFCAGFILQNLPLTDVMFWFVPEWVLMVFIFWHISRPGLMNYVWVWPLGLLMDAQDGVFLGTHVIGFTLVLYALQLMHQRLQVFNVVQQAAVIFLLVCCFRMVSYWAILVVDEHNQPLSLWPAALVSAVIWPWLQLSLSNMDQRLR